ncbi:hypothetical protein [Cohnella hongkongensis]|uniref:Peptidase M28 domain-containing protein n=1 Tax=Cohnella hongkongensis TaxID=178337 RepID=A0ABV9FIJ7_9BACL
MSLKTGKYVIAFISLTLIASLMNALPTAKASVRLDSFSVIEEWAGKAYQGRQAGTPGYAKTVDDLEQRMREVGMLPVLDEEQYRQSYEAGTATLKKEKVALNKTSLKLMKDYMPYARSASGAYAFRSAFYAGAGLAKDYKSKVEGLVLFRWNDRDGKFPEGIQDRIQRAVAQGAKGVAVIADGELKIGNYEHPLSAEQLKVPVIYISEKTAERAGVPSGYTPAVLNKTEFQIDLSIERSVTQADNLVGVIPGKSEEKAILWVTNIDGFGSLPDGTWYESAKAGSASAAMMLDLARYYKDHAPEYTMIFAFVGSKWKGQEGIEALADKLSFDRIACTVDLYAMGGTGQLDELYVNYMDPSFEAFAKAVTRTPIRNVDPGNALSSVLRKKTNRLLLVRDRDTWVDDSSADKAASLSRARYASGVESLLALSGRIAQRIGEEERVSFDYSKLPVSKAAFQNSKLTLHRIDTRYFHVYADDVYLSRITAEVLEEMDSIYRRVAKYNYYPQPQAKVNALFMEDGNAAAVLSGRKDLENRSEEAGGGFANLKDGQMYIYMRSGPIYETIAHELNHALASANAYAGDRFELQEWQGQSHFVRYSEPRGTYSNDIRATIRRSFLEHHEVPKLRQLVSDYKTAIDWSWYTKDAPNPDGHLYTYYVMGSMYAFLEDQYGEKAARRAMYRNYLNVADIQNNLVRETGLSVNAFMDKWSGWMLHSGTSVAAVEPIVRESGNTAFDYMLLYTNPDRREDGGEAGGSPAGDGETITNGTVRYALSVQSGDLHITALNLYKTKDGAKVDISYESGKNRSVSLFDPPDGDRIMLHRDKAIVPGKGKVTITLNEEQVRIVRSAQIMTLRFGEGEDFAVIEGAEFEKLLK